MPSFPGYSKKDEKRKLKMQGKTRLKLQSYAAEHAGLVTIFHSEYKWRKVRNEHIKKESVCQACGRDKDLEVHHIKPWHLFPSLRFDEDNLITLDTACHFRFGHLLNWKHWNPEIKVWCRNTQTLIAQVKERMNYE